MKKVILTIAVATLLFSIVGCSTLQEYAVSTKSGDVISMQKLKFSVVAGERGTFVPMEDFGGKANVTVYSDFSEIKILVDGTYTPFTEAIQDERITIPEVFAFAQLDAQNGFCKEIYRSERGLTHFIYSYPECTLRIAHDIYETPDGNQHLMEELYFIDTVEHAKNFYEVYTETGSGRRLDREDWGISFEVVDATPTQLTLSYTQQGGQQIGALVLADYYICHASEPMDIQNEFIGWCEKDAGGLPISILKNSSGQFTLDLPASIGELKPGEYYLIASVCDIYEESDVHPLMINYTDEQNYKIGFSVL